MVKKFTTAIILVMASLAVHAGENAAFPEFKGWKMQEEKRVYNSGDLWELIDGAADIFLSYYFQDLHIAEYTSKDRIIRVELYRHNSPANAYGIYTAERMPDYPQVAVGSQGYKSQGVLNFMAGNYYVKIMSAGVTEVDDNTLALLAGKVDDLLAQPVGLPEETTFFPEEGKALLSDSYIAQNFLGYSFFRTAYSARYGVQGEIQVFLIRMTPEEIQKMLEQYFAVMKADKVTLKDGYYTVEDMFNGRVFLKQKGNSLVGVLNTSDEKTALDYLNKVADKLP